MPTWNRDVRPRLHSQQQSPSERALTIPYKRPVKWPAVEGNAVRARLRAVVAVPAHNEQDHILACLHALSAQVNLTYGTYGVVCFLNNCVDRTQERVEAFANVCSCPLRVIVENHDAPSAGWARRQAMDAAVDWLDDVDGGPSGAVLTTDADSVVPADWVALNLAALDAGADAVAGRIVLDARDAARLPASLHERGRAEATYEALLTEIGARLDPDPGNPWPTHWTTSGATLGASRAAYRAVGGMPALVSGEDRAFADRIRALDLRLRQDPDIVVSTSGRLVGRAIGGAADTMAKRCAEPDSLCDDRLEPIGRALARILFRRRLRKRHEAGILGEDAAWARVLGLAADDVAVCLAAYGVARHFGAFHSTLERVSKRLAYCPVAPSRLGLQIVQARAIAEALRWRDRLPRARFRADGASTRTADLSPAIREIIVDAGTP